jgi:hypothetical protein
MALGVGCCQLTVSIYSMFQSLLYRWQEAQSKKFFNSIILQQLYRMQSYSAKMHKNEKEAYKHSYYRFKLVLNRITVCHKWYYNFILGKATFEHNVYRHLSKETREHHHHPLSLLHRSLAGSQQSN